MMHEIIYIYITYTIMAHTMRTYNITMHSPCSILLAANLIHVHSVDTQRSHLSWMTDDTMRGLPSFWHEKSY